jgi:phage major head subunit gpT-like protein
MTGRPVNLDLLRRTTRADFYSRLGVSESEALYPRVAMEVESDSDQETYAFFGAVVKPKRVDVSAGGGQAIENTPFKDYSQSLKNATWVSLQEVNRDIIEDAKLDMIKVRVQTMADSGVAWQDERMSAVIEANGNGYDGVAMFAGSHHGGSGNPKDSDLTSADDSSLDIASTASSTVCNPTVSDAENAVAACLARIRTYTDDQNRVANAGELGLVFLIPPGMERSFRAVLDITGQTILAPGSSGSSGSNQGLFSGVFRGRAQVVINPYSTNANIGYAFVTTKPIRAVVYQKRIPWEFNFITQGDDWEKREVGALKARSRFDFLLGDWKKGVRFTYS